MKKIKIFFLIIFLLDLNVTYPLFHDSIDWHQLTPTSEQYERLGQVVRDYLLQQSYRETVNPGLRDYQENVRNLLRLGELLSGAGRSFGSSRQGHPYTVTAEDKQLACNIFTFVHKELPQNTLNRGLQDWAEAGFLTLTRN